MYLQILAQRSLHFAQRQTHDFKLMLGRRTLHGLAAWLISQFGGIGVEGIRPLFAIQAFIFGLVLLLLTRLSAARARNGPADGRRILSGFVQVFKQGPELLACSVAC
jgi:hypothetical protein